MKKITYLIMFLLMLSTGYTQTTSHWGRTFKNAAGVVRSGLNIDLYAAGGAQVYALVESSSLPGYYYFDTISTGDYDVYINGVKTYSNVWIGTKKLTSMEQYFSSDGRIIVGTGIPDSTIPLYKFTTAAYNFIGSGGSVTNNPDDRTIINAGGSTLGVNEAWLDTTGTLWKLYGVSNYSGGVDSIGIYEHALNNDINNLKDRGAKGDGAINDAVALDSFLVNAPGKSVSLIPKGTYKIDAYKNVLSNTYIKGENYPIIEGSLKIDGDSNIIIEGVHFKGWGSTTVYGIYIDSLCSNITIRDCKFTNYSLFTLTSGGGPYTNIVIENCYFEVASLGIYADVIINLNNATNCVIRNNYVIALGTIMQGHIKAADSCYNVIIKDNIFLGYVSEEVCDFHMAGDFFTFSDNYINISSGGVVSYKPLNNTSTPILSKITNNFIVHTGNYASALLMGRGAEGLTWEGNKQQIVISNNQFYLDNAIGAIRIDGHYMAIVEGNLIYCKSNFAGWGITVQSVLHSIIKNNILGVGYLSVMKSTTHSYPTNYVGGTLTISGNQILDPYNYGYGCMRIAYLDSMDIIITENIFHLKNASNTAIFSIDNCNIKTLNVSNNIYQGISPGPTTELPIYATCTFDRLIEEDNNWGIEFFYKELTIASGVITAFANIHSIDTESDAGLDSLATINGGITGYRLILKTVSNSRDVTLMDGTGNLRLNGACPLTTNDQYIELIYIGTVWCELTRSLN